jgi:hypothetical protein
MPGGKPGTPDSKRTTCIGLRQTGHRCSKKAAWSSLDMSEPAFVTSDPRARHAYRGLLAEALIRLKKPTKLVVDHPLMSSAAIKLDERFNEVVLSKGFIWVFGLLCRSRLPRGVMTAWRRAIELSLGDSDAGACEPPPASEEPLIRCGSPTVIASGQLHEPSPSRRGG